VHRTLETGFAVLLIVGLVAGALRLLLPEVWPFVFAFMLAALIDAPTNHLEELGLSRGLAVLAVLTSLALCVVGVAALVVVNLVRDLGKLADQLPNLGTSIQEGISTGMAFLNHLAIGLPPPLAELMYELAGRITQTLAMLAEGFLSALAGLSSLLGGLAVGILATFFLARDGRKLASSAVENLPATWRSRTTHVKHEIFSGVVGLVRAQVLLIALSGALSTIALLVFQMPYAWLLGSVAGVLDLLPVVGPSMVFTPLVIWQWLIGHKVLAAGLGSTWVVVLLVRQALEPAILGSQLGLHPLTSLVAMYVAVRVWGVAGMFSGPLLATSLKALWLGALRPLLLGPKR
jgi:sporulation integral membrane protein YtvI